MIDPAIGTERVDLSWEKLMAMDVPALRGQVSDMLPNQIPCVHGSFSGRGSVFPMRINPGSQK